jgi:predicted dienelactone hydrolase
MMRALKLIFRAVAAVVAIVLLVFVVRMWLTEPRPPAAGSESARRLEPGPFEVGSIDHTFIDATRPTMANGGVPASSKRELVATIWYPLADDSAHPLAVYSHGFMSLRIGGAYLAEDLASHGYVVVSADFPLTNFFAPGGPNVDDGVNQPADVEVMIDHVLEWDASERPFKGIIDRDRIGVFGVSLGGLTSTLVAYHPKLRDPRVRAAISIAGPMILFSEKFFARSDVAFLMIGGTSDAMVDYDHNAALVPQLVPGGELVTVRGGTHAGFSNFASGVMRVLGNPDDIGCRAIAGHLHVVPHHNPFASLGGPEEGMLANPDVPLPCAGGVPDGAILAGRQQMITKLAVYAFFESVFAKSAEERQANARYLRETLPHDFPEASFAGPAKV